jgi:hypothetical protein
VIVEARSSDAAFHHSPSWSNSTYIVWRCVLGLVLLNNKDMEVGTKNLIFGLIRQKDTFPPVYCPLLMLLGPSKSLLIIGVFKSFFL